METVRLIRSELPDFPLMVRLSATEYVDGGYSLDDIVTLSKALEAAGVIAIDLSGGTNETPELSRYCIQPPSFPRRFLEPHARPIKDAVTVPVIMAGRMLTPRMRKACCKPAVPTTSRFAVRWSPIRTGASRPSAK